VTLTVRRLTRHLGAEVSGIDLRRPTTPGQQRELRHALGDHLVLFFRDQVLSDGEHLQVAEIFGTPNVFPTTRARGRHEPLEWIEDTADSPPKADLWHTDVAFLPRPPEVAVLSMQVVPPVGGDTLWLSLYALFDALSAGMQQLTRALALDLHPGPDFKAKTELQFGPGIYEKVAAEFGGATHPLVRRHPQTGRPALFLCGAYMQGIHGLSARESEVLIALLREGLNDPGIQCRWHWQVNDLAIWDERCTNHRALSDHWPARRLVRRCTVGASAPVAAGAPSAGHSPLLISQ
jgi:taurine dioxygenase